MNILIIGSGGREHALTWKLSQSNKNEIHTAPGNAGMAKISTTHDMSTENIEAIVDLAKTIQADLVVVGPEAPLVKGLGDRLRKEGIFVFGPSMNAARLEGSKIFTKEFCDRYNIPTARYKTCHTKDETIGCAGAFGYPVVVKADGLAAGKGVLICEDEDDVKKAASTIFDRKAFGQAGSRVIVEEFLDGEEASYIAICDGNAALPLASSQDHKRAYDGDKGPNTGGMGAYSPAPVVTKEVEKKIFDNIIKPTLKGMKNDGSPFVGALYAGLMIKNGEPKLLEYNVRFGDPETQPLLYRMKSDLTDILYAAARGELADMTIEWHDESSVCVVMASGGYPGEYRKGDVISGLDDVEKMQNVQVFHAGTKIDADGNTITSGGRVLGVTAKAQSIKEAQALAYKAANKIKWRDCYYRKDIAHRAILT